MSIIADSPYQITMVAKDGEGHTADINFWLDGGASIGTCQAFVESMKPLVSAITKCSIENVYVSRLINTFAASASVDKGDVEIGAQFIWRANGTNKTMTQRIPGIEPALIPANTNKVDLAAASVVAFVNAMKDGVGSPLVEPRDSETRTIESLVSATESYTKARK